MRARPFLAGEAGPALTCRSFGYRLVTGWSGQPPWPPSMARSAGRHPAARCAAWTDRARSPLPPITCL